jgi:ribosomal protein S18 acetylase RimI-like enzyme
MSKLSDAKISIRRARAADLPSLLELGTELMRSDRRFDPLFKEDWYTSEPGKKYIMKKIRGGQHVCFIAETNGQLIGYATGSINKTETWRPVTHSELGNLYVQEDYRRHGVGHHLLAAMRQWSKKKGVEKMIVHVTSGNSDGLAFYEKSGFNTETLIMEGDL